MQANQAQPLVHNFNKLFLSLLLVLLFGGPVISQDNLNSDIDSLESDAVIADDKVLDSPLKQMNVDEELAKKGMNRENLKTMLDELKKANPEGFAKMEAGELTPEESNKMMEETLKKLPPKTMMKMMGGTSDIFAEKLKGLSKGLNSVPFESALANIKTQVDSSKAAPLFKMIPKSHEFLTHFLRDEEATSKFFGIVKDRKRLLIFAGINIFLLFLSWRIKARRKKMNYSAGVSFSKGMQQFLVFNVIKMCIIWYFFSVEIKPLWGVIQKTYS